ncbi:uncharacterized protein DUF4440 [Mucilaginibacter oryzae]|uniref:Uncharacterized protein DUF4440 n=1 Tax=Mucilaginibacter oryzae TaxID=468058 RepID=A0A316HAT9_9SPHI|nr:nuclear transport factor 2 family protein [Mucilaginibacter oryzae]PWK67079.1 uncharacterized protein DUF4440 [Mucilaginibacter oryzae]
MKKHLFPLICLCMLIAVKASASSGFPADTVVKLKPEVKQIIEKVIKASGTFSIDEVSDLYAPNAVVADEQPPFSWNGQLAGVQWINSVEKAVKDFKIKDFKVDLQRIKTFQQTDEIVYLVAPVEYTGTVNGEHFEEQGAFSFVLRVVSGKWLIKSQAWVPRNGM